MNFYYHPILGLQWDGGVRPFRTFIMDELAIWPMPEPYIKTNAVTTFISGLKKKIRWKN